MKLFDIKLTEPCGSSILALVQDFNIDYDSFKVKIPIEFSSKELQDSWVRIRPNSASAFKISFFDKTPKRMYLPKQINADLDT